MTIPKIENRWTLGNVLTLGGMFLQVLVLGGGGLWYASQQDARLTAVEQADLRNVAEMAELRLQAAENRRSISVLDVARARDDERFSNILQFLTRIDTRLERIEQRANP